MLGYVTLGTNDMARAAAFYDAFTAAFGASRTMDRERVKGWGPPGALPSPLVIARPFDGQSASAGNGAMAALRAESREQVDRAYALALSLGGADEGAPGLRGTARRGFYAAYFRDLDGNKLCIFAIG